MDKLLIKSELGKDELSINPVNDKVEIGVWDDKAGETVLLNEEQCGRVVDFFLNRYCAAGNVNDELVKFDS